MVAAVLTPWLVAGASQGILAARPSSVSASRPSNLVMRADMSEERSRRAIIGSVLPLVLTATCAGEAALASGGATAGRTTSIPTAKKRYFSRVKADVGGFLRMGRPIQEGKLTDASVAAFFAGKESPYDDLKSAGYLLAVAFKIDARIPPQKIQQKRDHDALIKSLDDLRSAVDKKDAKLASTAYATALAKLETYLDGVELPPTSDSATYV